MFLGSCSNDCFNLHTPSAPELFSRTAPAATAAALTMGRFGILMPSETSLSRQLWAYSRRSSSASAWRFGNQTATTCCYLQYRFSMPNIYIYIMWDWNLHHLWRNSKQNCLHLQRCQVCDVKLKETNMSCAWTGLQLAFLPLSPMAASETSQQRVAKIRCIGCIGLGPIGCTWMYMDVQCILAMSHLVARVPLSSCYQYTPLHNDWK